MIIQGKSISPGVARGVAHCVDAGTILQQARAIPSHGPARLELERFRAAVGWAGAQLKRIKRQLGRRVANQDIAIFDTHASILQDAKFTGMVEQEITENRHSAEAAVAVVALRLYELFSASRTSMLEDKAADILDIGRRLVHSLSTSEQGLEQLAPKSIVVADEIAPSELVHYAHQGAVGFTTSVCGTRSHTAILARGLGLPLVTGIDLDFACGVEELDVLLDGTHGIVIVRPTADEAEQVRSIETHLSHHLAPAGSPMLDPVTADGVRIKLLLNVSDIVEAAAVRKLGADGIGLVRTEFLYMDRSWWPTSDETYADYREIAQAIGDGELCIRLADFGAEKSPAYADIPVNRNPSLGLRGIRLLLQREDILRPQLQAIARLAAEHPLTLLLPMLDTLDTLEHTVRKICSLTGCGGRNQLPFQLGAMVELPSAALMIGEIADRVDSISIGLNDLTQYVLAVDRDDELVETYHDALQPAVLRLVRQIIKAGEERGKPVTVCGELAGDPTLTGMILALGLRRLSVSSTSYPGVLAAIRAANLTDASAISDRLLQMTSGAAVRDFVIRKYLQGKNAT